MDSRKRWKTFGSKRPPRHTVCEKVNNLHADLSICILHIFGIVYRFATSIPVSVVLSQHCRRRCRLFFFRFSISVQFDVWDSLMGFLIRYIPFDYCFFFSELSTIQHIIFSILWPLLRASTHTHIRTICYKFSVRIRCCCYLVVEGSSTKAPKHHF